MKKLAIKQDAENQVPFEVMAGAIADIGSAMKKLSQSRLKREVIVTLIKDRSGYSKRMIEIILNNLEQLEELYLKK